MKTWMMPDVQRYSRMTTDELRATFLVENLFKKGEIVTHYLDVDRTIVGSAVPAGGGSSHGLVLATAQELRAAYFLERRELGILNIGGPGAVIVDGKSFEMEHLDCLYAGRGSKEVRFTSHEGAGGGAQYYLLSYPAHTAYPTTLAKKSQAAAVPLGKQESLNKRTIYKYIHMEGIKSCQLVMGFTELEVGSGWNTMPPHTHLRRSEVYLYFNLAGHGPRIPPDGHAPGNPAFGGRRQATGHLAKLVNPCRHRHNPLHFLLGHGRRKPGV